MAPNQTAWPAAAHNTSEKLGETVMTDGVRECFVLYQKCNGKIQFLFGIQK